MLLELGRTQRYIEMGIVHRQIHRHGNHLLISVTGLHSQQLLAHRCLLAYQPLTGLLAVIECKRMKRPAALVQTYRSMTNLRGERYAILSSRCTEMDCLLHPCSTPGRHLASGTLWLAPESKPLLAVTNDKHNGLMTNLYNCQYTISAQQWREYLP